MHECAFQKVSKLCILNFLTNTQVEINSKLNEQSQRIFLAFSSIHKRTYKLYQNSSPQKSDNAIQHNPVHTTSHHFSRSRFRISTFFCLLGVDKSGELPISCSPCSCVAMKDGYAVTCIRQSALGNSQATA